MASRSRIDRLRQTGCNESRPAGRKLRLSGGVCDYTEPATSKNKQFFPVEPAQPAE